MDSESKVATHYNPNHKSGQKNAGEMQIGAGQGSDEKNQGPTMQLNINTHHQRQPSKRMSDNEDQGETPILIDEKPENTIDKYLPGPDDQGESHYDQEMEDDQTSQNNSVFGRPTLESRDASNFEDRNRPRYEIDPNNISTNSRKSRGTMGRGANSNVIPFEEEEGPDQGEFESRPSKPIRMDSSPEKPTPAHEAITKQIEEID